MILILGAGGQLGTSLRGLYKEHALGLGKSDLNIVDREAVMDKISDLKPDLVINCAAYTGVDASEAEPDVAYKVNAYGAGNVALACAKVGCRLVHISTDYVFSGQSTRPYTEDDSPLPLNMYGTTKLKGEELVCSLMNNYYIVRTAWLFGPGTNVIDYILNVMEQDKTDISVVMDQFGCPTYTEDLAVAISKIISTDLYGIYHVVNAGCTNWYQFAKTAGILDGSPQNINPIATADYIKQYRVGKVTANRPRYSVLEISKAVKLGVRMRSWQDALAAYIVWRKNSKKS